MRTTLTLDDDVAAILKRLRKSRDVRLKDLVNEALRRGLKDMASRTKRRVRLQTRSVALGRLRIASLDNVGEALAVAEGEAYRTAEVLDAGQSAALRDKLLAEVASLASPDSAVMWAAGALPAKNSLIGADAKVLEDAFEQKTSGFPSPSANDVFAGEGATAAGKTLQEEPQASRG
jgi:hypothetical protein